MSARRIDRLMPMMRRGFFMAPWRRPGFGPMRHDFFDTAEQEMNQMMNRFRQMMPVMMDNHFNFDKWTVDNPIVKDKDGNRKLLLNFDVGHFAPENINIKVKDGTLSVQAKSSEGEEGSKILREYMQQVTLPEEVKVEDLKSIYNQNGVLTVEAPLPPLKEGEEVAINIEHESSGKNEKSD